MRRGGDKLANGVQNLLDEMDTKSIKLLGFSSHDNQPTIEDMGVWSRRGGCAVAWAAFTQSACRMNQKQKASCARNGGRWLSGSIGWVQTRNLASVISGHGSLRERKALMPTDFVTIRTWNFKLEMLADGSRGKKGKF